MIFRWTRSDTNETKYVNNGDYEVNYILSFPYLITGEFAKNID